MRVWEFYLRIRILVQHVISLVCAEGSEALLTELTATQDVPDIPVFPLPPRPGHHGPLPSLPAPSAGHADSQYQGESDRESCGQQDS